MPCAGYVGYPLENGASKMAVSVRFLCHLPNEEMAIPFSSTISCLIVERISQVASTGTIRDGSHQYLWNAKVTEQEKIPFLTPPTRFSCGCSVSLKVRRSS